MTSEAATYRPSENDGTRVQVNIYDVTLWDHLHARHLPLGQHFVDKVVPGDVAAAAVDAVEQAHDDADDEEHAEAFPVHLVLPLATLLLLWERRGR